MAQQITTDNLKIFKFQVETYRKQASTTGCFAPSEHIDRFGGDNAARTRSNGVQASSISSVGHVRKTQIDLHWNNDLRNKRIDLDLIFLQLQVDWYYVWGLCLKDLAKLCNEGQFDKLVEINDEILRIYGKPVNIFMIGN